MSWNPNWSYGYVPTAAQWNDAFGRKQDNLGYTPLNQAGGTMTGPLNILASTTESAGLRLFPGVAPTNPDDGDIWVEATGLFVRVNNVSVGPLVAGNSITDINPATTGTINNMVIGGTTPRAGTFTTLKASGGITPVTNDGGAIGSTSLQWSDFFLAAGGIINFSNGDVTITHSSNLLTISKGLTVSQAFTVSGSFTANGAAALSPASANVVLAPTGTGLVTINPATVGGMDNMVIGANTPKAVTATTLALSTGTIASAATTDLSTVAGSTITVTGNATITSFGTLPAGSLKFLRFTGAPTLTYNATSLILPGAGNITVTAGDTAVLQSLGSGNWLVLSYQNAAVSPPSCILTKWVSYTPTVTGFGTTTSAKFWSRRVGPDLEIMGAFTSGTSTATTAAVSLGFNGVSGGLTIDTFWNSARFVCGSGASSLTGPIDYAILGVGGGGEVNFGASVSGRASLTPVTGSGLLASGDSFSFQCSVPIQGWNV